MKRIACYGHVYMVPDVHVDAVTDALVRGDRAAAAPFIVSTRKHRSRRDGAEILSWVEWFQQRVVERRASR